MLLVMLSVRQVQNLVQKLRSNCTQLPASPWRQTSGNLVSASRLGVLTPRLATGDTAASRHQRGTLTNISHSFQDQTAQERQDSTIYCLHCYSLHVTQRSAAEAASGFSARYEFSTESKQLLLKRSGASQAQQSPAATWPSNTLKQR